MNTFIDFLVKNWQFISTIITTLLLVILLIIKKRPKSIDDFSNILDIVITKVPDFVIQAENVLGAGNGSEKKMLVINYALKEFKRLLGRDLTTNESDTAILQFSSSIEAVLNAPQKKGV